MTKSAQMKSSAPPFSLRRLKWAWKLYQAARAEDNGEFDRAMRILEEAAEIRALDASNRVQQAMLLLKSQRLHEANNAFAVLRDEFKGSENPDIQYLRHYCTSMLSSMHLGSGQWSYEAKKAKAIKCSPYVKHRFRMVTVDEIHDAIKPRP